MRTDFRTLYEELSKMGFLVQIMSNISMIDESVMEWLKNTPPYCINTTIYGSNNSVYKSVTGVESGFDRFDRALNLLLSANIPVTIKTVLTKLNEDDAPNMYNYCAKHGIKLISSYGVNKAVRGATSDAAIIRRLRYDPPDSLPDDVSFVKRSDEHGPYPHHKNYLDDCGAYGNTIHVSWDGHAILCSFMAEPFMDLKELSVKDAWPLFLNKVDQIKKPAKCINCKYEEYCTRCPGALAAEYGSYDIVSDNFCRAAKYLYSQYNKGDCKDEKDLCKTNA